MKSVNKAIRKKDAMELLLGKPVYTDDIAPVSYTHLAGLIPDVRGTPITNSLLSATRLDLMTTCGVSVL